MFKMDTLNGSLPIQAQESVATHNISPRLIQLKQTRKPSLHLSSHNRKTPIRPFNFYQKIYMTATRFFNSSPLEDSTGGSI